MFLCCVWVLPAAAVCWLAAEALGVAATGVWPAGPEAGLSPFSRGADFRSVLRSAQVSASSWTTRWIMKQRSAIETKKKKRRCRSRTHLSLRLLLHVLQGQSRQLLGPLLQEVHISNRVGQSLYHICRGICICLHFQWLQWFKDWVFKKIFAKIFLFMPKSAPLHSGRKCTFYFTAFIWEL